MAAIALLLAVGQAPALAATLTVAANAPPGINADGACSLIEAIENANADAATHADCVAGSGADLIELPAGSTQTLTSSNNSTYGDTGLPLIISTLTIEGHGSTIVRDSVAPDFRILAVDSTGDLTLNETTVSGGVAARTFPHGYGGGIANYGTLTLTNSTVSGNSAYFGGGVFNRYGTATLTNSTVSGNSAGTFSFYGTRNGGGVNNLSGTLTLTNSTVSGNSASESGGGVNNFGTLTLTNSTVSGNSAGESGGGVNNDGTLTLTNSTVSGNSAYGKGGGISNYDGPLTLTNSTVSGNIAVFAAGGVFIDRGTLTLTRTLVAGNTAPEGEEVGKTGGAVTADNFNLFGHNGLTDAQAFFDFTPGPSDLTATSDGTIPTALSAILDTTLADNGGPTQTHALIAGSPAIDASPADADCERTDQRGVSRPQGAACDIGAFEFTEGPPDACATAVPTTGCTVNGVPEQLCRGTSGNDQILGTAGNDVILGLEGSDVLRGRGGDDLLCGGEDNDALGGRAGSDQLFGGGGDDRLGGGLNADSLDGGPGADSINGGVGTNTCATDAEDVSVVNCDRPEGRRLGA